VTTASTAADDAAAPGGLGRGRAVLGRAADTGFLLLPLTALVLTIAVLLAIVLADTFLVPTGCSLATAFDQRCTLVVNHFSTFFANLLVPGALLFLWRAWLRRLRTRPLDAEQFPAAAEVIDGVLADTPLRRPMPIRVGPRLRRRAFTSGFDRWAFIAFGPELLTLPAKGAAGRGMFEAVFRHELAHVQNRDLARGYSASVLRISLRTAAVVTVLYLIGAAFWAEDPPTVGTGVVALLRALVVAAVAELAVRAFFRIREHEADLRAAGADAASLRAALPGGSAAGHGWRDRVRAPGWLSRHPRAADRRAAVDDPAAVLRFPLGQVLAGGLFAGVGLGCVQVLYVVLQFADVIHESGRIDTEAWASILLPAVSVGLPAGVFLSLGVWRDVWWGQLTGRRSRPWLIGLVFAAGLLVGSYLVPYRALVPGMHGSGGIRITWAGLLLLGGGAAADAAPAARLPRTLLVVAVPVVAGLVVLIWRVTQFVAGQLLMCFPAARCGGWALDWLTLQVAVEWFVQRWLVVLVVLVVAGLVAAAVRSAGLAGSARPAARAGLITAAASAIALLWMFPLGGDRAGWFGFINPALDSARVAAALQVMLLTGIVLVAALPRRFAGAFAAGGALVVGLVCTVAEMIGLSDLPAGLRTEVSGYLQGDLLGMAQVLSWLVIAAALGVRRLAGRLPVVRRALSALDQAVARIRR